MLKPVGRSTSTITLYQGEDYFRFETLNDAYYEAVNRIPAPEAARMGDAEPTDDTEALRSDPAVAAAARALDKFKDEAAERGVVVTVGAVPRRTYRELVAKHPARPDHEVDATRGWNVETFPDDFVPASLPLAGQFEDEDARRAWVDDLSPGNFSKLLRKALKVNGEDAVVDPLVSVASRLGLSDAPTSDESSAPPERLG
jgi:hypothetical protein